MIGFLLWIGIWIWWLSAKKPHARRIRYRFRLCGFVIELDRWTNSASHRKADLFGD